MTVPETQLNARSADFQAPAAAVRALLDDLNAPLATAALGGREGAQFLNVSAT